MIFFSIIIPLYNKEKHIQKTIESVLNQTYTDFEIIIVNDGSTDTSLEIVNQFTDTRITVYSQKNKGVSSARNFGLTKANGKFIVFLDADDFWETNHLEELNYLSTKFPDAGLFCSRYTTIFTEKLKVKSTYNSINDNYEGYVDDFFKSSMHHRIACIGCLAIKSEVLKNIGHFNENYTNGEDLDLWIRIALKHKVVIGKKHTFIYNLTGSTNLSKTNEATKIHPDFTEFIDAEKKKNSLKTFLDLYRTEFALHLKRVGKNKNAKKLIKQIHLNNLTWKSKFLLQLPSFVLQFLFKTKHLLKKLGLDFTVYH